MGWKVGVVVGVRVAVAVIVGVRVKVAVAVLDAVGVKIVDGGGGEVVEVLVDIMSSESLPTQLL